jgi:hypothetical protein
MISLPNLTVFSYLKPHLHLPIPKTRRRQKSDKTHLNLGIHINYQNLWFLLCTLFFIAFFRLVRRFGFTSRGAIRPLLPRLQTDACRTL